MVPAGPKGQYSATYGDGIGIAAASKNKEAAYLLCQWAVSKAQGARLLQAGGGVPFRNSVLNDEEVRKGVKLPKEWLQSVHRRRARSASSACRSSSRSPSSAIWSAPAVTATLAGADPAAELKKAHEQFRPILERSEKASYGAHRPSPRMIPRIHALRRSMDSGFQPGSCAENDAMPRNQVPSTSTEQPEPEWRPPSYWPFVLPALVVVLAVIVFPWLFTIWMSLNEWKVGQPTVFVGLANYLRMPNDPRFVEAVWHTLVYTVLSVILPLIFGTFAAVVFHQKFPLRGFLRGLFIMPMMATPVAIALVWTMMFHPQLGVLNYLLSLVGLPPQLWVFHPGTVIPSLVLVETWQWTPLVMLIVLGGLAAIPTEPYESALIDGASFWQMFRYITLPLITPFLFIAAMIRLIDALKSFDIIFAITQGGPGSASETINLYLYSVAFVYYDIGYGSAIALVFFVLIVMLAAVMLYFRQRMHWNEAGGGA